MPGFKATQFSTNVANSGLLPTIPATSSFPLTFPVEKQVLVFYAVTKKHFKDIEAANIQKTEADLLKFFEAKHGEILNKIRTEKQISTELGEAIEAALAEFKR